MLDLTFGHLVSPEIGEDYVSHTYVGMPVACDVWDCVGFFPDGCTSLHVLVYREEEESGRSTPEGKRKSAL